MLASFLALVALGAIQSQPERRCGWLQNPTPANWWLVDRDGEWLIGAQGGYQAPGMDNMPDMTTRGWVRTNGYYGHGCACMTVETDRRTMRITRIRSASPVPLSQCRRDRRLPRL
ncbi:MAG: DUF4087 domain-containing protein [Sphingosinicella sp.]|uniref:DUF4087 domain-containing protein n=1 Tax=Sphingosinicella sp. TaxID=1917971 RepID=UPI004037BAB9